MKSESPRRTLVLDTTQLEPFEIGAQLDALLSFPGELEDDRRRRVADAICARQIAITIEAFPERANALRRKYPKYLQRENRTSLKRLDFRRFRSLLTGFIAITFLKEAMTGEPLVLPAGVARRTVATMARYVLTRKDGEEEGRYLNRVEEFVRREWPHCRPVAHLSSAYLQEFRALREAEGVDMLEFDLQNFQFHRTVVDLAAKHAAHLRVNPRTPWAAGELVDIVWIN